MLACKSRCEKTKPKTQRGRTDVCHLDTLDLIQKIKVLETRVWKKMRKANLDKRSEDFSLGKGGFFLRSLASENILPYEELVKNFT